MKKEDAQKQIEAGIRTLHEALAAGKSEEMERYLKLMSKFHRYSFGNVLAATHFNTTPDTNSTPLQ